MPHHHLSLKIIAAAPRACSQDQHPFQCLPCSLPHKQAAVAKGHKPPCPEMPVLKGMQHCTCRFVEYGDIKNVRP